MKIFESEMRNKSVMSDEGTYLGVLRNATVNPTTGDLLNILVEPSEEIDPRLYDRDNHGHLVFPFKSVRSVRNVVILGSS